MINKPENSIQVCLVSFPMPSALVVDVFLTSLTQILEPICDSLCIVTANMTAEKYQNGRTRLWDVKTSMHFRDSIRPKWWSIILQLFKIIAIQAKTGWALVRLSGKTNLVLFYVGGANLFPIVITAKMLRKKVAMAAIGSGALVHKHLSNVKNMHAGGGRGYPRILSLLETINYRLADYIIVESQSVADFLGLHKYEGKLMTGGARYIDTGLFRVQKRVSDRDNLVGYIGRLEEGKGVMNLFRAIPSVLEKQGNIEFIFIGDGPLHSIIKDELKNKNLYGKIELKGWVSHDKVAGCLNELKLLVLPSYSEGLPTAVLEAMACGTPVLATSVGGIPDVIKDEETGFIMGDNSPECIARNIVRALNHPNLEVIASNACTLTEGEFNYEVVVKRYKDMLSKILAG